MAACPPWLPTGLYATCPLPFHCLSTAFLPLFHRRFHCPSTAFPLAFPPPFPLTFPLTFRRRGGGNSRSRDGAMRARGARLERVVQVRPHGRLQLHCLWVLPCLQL